MQHIVFYQTETFRKYFFLLLEYNNKGAFLLLKLQFTLGHPTSFLHNWLWIQQTYQKKVPIVHVNKPDEFL